MRKCITREAVRAAAKVERTTSAPTVDVSRIEAAFAVARQGAAADREGLKWLRLRLDTFVVLGRASERPVGRGDLRQGGRHQARPHHAGGKLICAPDTSAETKARILAALADPAAGRQGATASAPASARSAGAR